MKAPLFVDIRSVLPFSSISKRTKGMKSVCYQFKSVVTIH